VERKLRHGGKWQRRLAPTVKGGTAKPPSRQSNEPADRLVVTICAH
jgi:hypothetical protein